MSEVRRIAYEDRAGNFIFVKVPGEYGRYVRTNWTVALSSCPACGSDAGVPCIGQYKRYTGSTHADRHVAAYQLLRDQGVNINSAARNSEEHPVIRDDILEAEDDSNGPVKTHVDLREYFK